MQITTASIAGMGRSACRVWDWAVERPVLAVVVASAIARLSIALILNLFDIWSLAPDAGQYLRIAVANADGRLAEVRNGYGLSLYSTTRSFSGQLWILVELFGPYRLLGQLLAVFYGVLTAGLTVCVALRLVRPAFALLAGMIVAFLPSQILHSSVGLRESLVWALLAAAAVICSRLGPRVSRPSIVIGVAGLAVLFCILVSARNQTAVIALWCMTVALVAVRGHRLLRCGSAAVLFLVVPLLIGHSPGGMAYLMDAGSGLGTVRTYMTMAAESAINELEPLSLQAGDGDAVQAGDGDLVQAGDGDVVQAGDGDVVQAGDGDAVQAGDGDAVQAGVTSGGVGDDTYVPVFDRDTYSDPAGRQKFVIDKSGRAVVVRNELPASLKVFPKGLLAVTLRPAPWEAATSRQFQFAGFENIIWLPLFVFAGVGAWVRRRDVHLVAFPASLFISLTLAAAVTQGNLGTAFRHRGQVLWALAILAVAAVQHIRDRSIVGPVNGKSGTP